MGIHTLKTWKLNLYDQYFQDVKTGLKTFEIRRNKRNFKIGDLIEFTNKKTGEKIIKEICYLNYTKQVYKDTNLVIIGFKND